MDQRTVQLQSTCPLDCPDLCALEVTLTDGRVTKLDGVEAHSVTRGFICGKVRHFAEHVYSRERLLTPARRVGRKGEGRFAPITWDEAYDAIVAQFQTARDTHGAESILPFCYGGSNGKLTHDAFDARLFRRLGASNLARTVCAAPTGRVATAMYGKMHGVAFEDYVAAQLIVIWGANPHATGIHLVPFLREARQRGAKLVVVDPRATPLARQADLHLALRPGTDVVVALSMLRWFFETGTAHEAFLETHTTGAAELRQRAAPWTFEKAAEVAGVAPQELQEFTELYARSNPAVIRCGWGLERSRNGGSNVAAVLALPAVAGKFGVRGGGYTLSNSGAWAFNPDAAINQRAGTARTVNMNHLGRALLEERSPPIQVLFVYNANPLATIPNQQLVRAGLEREDLFTVVFDQVLTDTARYADLVLPATTFLEHQDVRAGYGCSDLRHISPVIEPVGEARPNYVVFAELCRRLDLARPDDPETPQAFVRQLLSSYPTADRVVEDLWSQTSVPAPCGTRPVQFVDVTPATPDGKVQLFPLHLDHEAPQGLYGFLPQAEPEHWPLQMISPATEHLVNSTLGQLLQKTAELLIHPADAEPRGITTGARVRVFNSLGNVECLARLSDEPRPGLVVLPKGLWSRHTFNGQTANSLAPDHLTDIAGGACFNDARVEVALWQEARR